MKTKKVFISILLAISLLPLDSAFAANPTRIRKSPAPIIDAGGEGEIKPTIIYQVPYIHQAPNNNWRNKIFSDACEEASIIMAMSWISGQAPASITQEITNIARLEVEKFGFHQDTSATDTADIMKSFYGFEAEIKKNISVHDVLSAIEQKQLVILPINGGQFYVGGGVPRHQVVVVGYDYAANQFLVHDPLLKNGAYLRVDEKVLADSLRDYPSGIHKRVTTRSTSMIVVAWPWANPPQTK